MGGGAAVEAQIDVLGLQGPLGCVGAAVCEGELSREALAQALLTGLFADPFGVDAAYIVSAAYAK